MQADMNHQELQEQQLPVKLQTEEAEEFQDAVEVRSVAGHSSSELVSVHFRCTKMPRTIFAAFLGIFGCISMLHL